MEMTVDGGLWQHAEVDEATQVGAVRRLAALVAADANLDDEAGGRIALIAVELATNLVKHARRGRMFLRASAGGADVVAIDEGPGMDLAACFADGYSTQQTAGTGLGAVRRQAAFLDAFSDARGTVVYARVGAAPPAHGSLALPVRGESLSGDDWILRRDGHGWRLAMADGLGHGPLAHTAATAVTALVDFGGDPAEALQRAHLAARGTRGAAALFVRHDAARAQLAYASVGNVHCVADGEGRSQALPTQNGTVGATLPPLRGRTLAAAAARLVIAHTDGLSSRWSLDAYPGLRARHPQVACAVLFRDYYRARDDATIVAIRS